jgi:hypothetical protein
MRNQGFAQLDRTVIDTQYCAGDDIWVQDYLYGPGFFGRAWCDDLNSAGRCDIYIVQFNESTTGGFDTTALKWVGCHEFGHTGSVSHRFSSNDTNNDSCMRDDGTRYITLDAHDLDAINIGF